MFKCFGGNSYQKNRSATTSITFVAILFILLSPFFFMLRIVTKCHIFKCCQKSIDVAAYNITNASDRELLL